MFLFSSLRFMSLLVLSAFSLSLLFFSLPSFLFLSGLFSTFILYFSAVSLPFLYIFFLCFIFFSLFFYRSSCSPLPLLDFLYCSVLSCSFMSFLYFHFLVCNFSILFFPFLFTFFSLKAYALEVCQLNFLWWSHYLIKYRRDKGLWLQPWLR